jgi:catechol 2,3-dioxygenase-like lactoylglutathione lyase family enzyme
VGVDRISAVLCAGDLARSQAFYEQVVGLTLSVETIPNHLLFECGTGRSSCTDVPAPNAADHAQVRLWSDDVERDVRELETRGAIFADYDFPTLKTVNHVATTPGIGKSAWVQRSGRQRESGRARSDRVTARWLGTTAS